MIARKPLSLSASFMSTASLIAVAVLAWTVVHVTAVERANKLIGLTRIEDGAVKTLVGSPEPQNVSAESARVSAVAGQPRRARTDMLVHAAGHGIPVESELSFGLVDGFDPQWNLYYAEFATADGPVTLYTAVNRREPAIRCTATWDHEHGCSSPWEPALR